MIKKLLFSLTILATAVTVFGQGIFQNDYDFGNDDYSNKLQFTSHGVAAVGSTNSTGAGGYDCSLMSFDSTGNLLWEKQYGGPNTEYGTSMSSDPSNGGSFSLIGRTNSFTANHNHDVLLVKTDVNGDMLWAKSYGSDSIEYGLSIGATPDGGNILTGQTQAFGHGGWDLFMIKTDSLGNIQWSKTYGSPGDDIGNFVTYAGDGGYLAVGTSDYGSQGHEDIYLIKTDSAGAIQAQLLIGGSGYDGGLGFLSENDTTFLIAGTTASDASSVDQVFVMSFNAKNLTLNWSNIYGGGVNDQFSSIQFNPQGFFVVGASSNSYGNGSQNLIFAIDTAGTILGSEAIGGGADEFLGEALPLSDGTMYLTGSTNSFGGVNSDVYMARTSPNGSLCNHFQQVVPATTAWVPTIVGPVVPNHSSNPAPFTVSNLTLTQSTNNSTTTDICGLTTAMAKVQNLSVSVIPNPSNGNFTIDLSQLNANTNQVDIFDVTGKSVYSNLLGSAKMNIALPEVAGMYIVRVESNKEFFYQKLIVE